MHFKHIQKQEKAYIEKEGGGALSRACISPLCSTAHSSAPQDLCGSNVSAVNKANGRKQSASCVPILGIISRLQQQECASADACALFYFVLFFVFAEQHLTEHATGGDE